MAQSESAQLAHKLRAGVSYGAPGGGFGLRFRLLRPHSLAGDELQDAQVQRLRQRFKQRDVGRAETGFPHLKTLVYIQSILPTKR